MLGVPFCSFLRRSFVGDCCLVLSLAFALELGKRTKSSYCGDDVVVGLESCECFLLDLRERDDLIWLIAARCAAAYFSSRVVVGDCACDGMVWMMQIGFDGITVGKRCR